MSPRAVAATVAGTIAAVVVALISVDLFYVGVVVAAVVWIAVLIDQRDEACRAGKADRKARLLAVNRQLSLLAENLALKAKVKEAEAKFFELDQQNMHLLDVVTEHRLTTDPTTRVPRLHLVEPITDDDWFTRLYDERGNAR